MKGKISNYISTYWLFFIIISQPILDIIAYFSFTSSISIVLLPDFPVDIPTSRTASHIIKSFTILVTVAFFILLFPRYEPVSLSSLSKILLILMNGLLSVHPDYFALFLYLTSSILFHSYSPAHSKNNIPVC